MKAESRMQKARLTARSAINFFILHSSSAFLQGVTRRSDHSRDANPGGRQDFTGLVVAVQLRRRVAFGLQTLTVKSRLLTGENTVRFRGSPPFQGGKKSD